MGEWALNALSLILHDMQSRVVEQSEYVHTGLNLFKNMKNDSSKHEVLLHIIKNVSLAAPVCVSPAMSASA